MTNPSKDQRSAFHKTRDEQIAAEPPLPAPNLSPDSVPAPVEIHLCQADEQAVMQAFLVGTAIDPEVTRRVQERSRMIRAEVVQEHGLMDVAVPAIRELRGPLP